VKKYICVRPLARPMYDDECFPVEDKEFVVQEGTEWKVDEEADYKYVAGSDAYRLVDEDGQWLEIYSDTLIEHFEEIV
jgi:hypothetical protein